MEVMEKFSLFPWDNNITPDFINDRGFEWYIDKSLTRYCKRKTIDNKLPLKAICFYVCERKHNNVNAISRVLIDIDTNKVIADETSLEGMAIKIDMLRMLQNQKL